MSAAGFVFAVFLAMAVAWLDGWLRAVLSVECLWLGSGRSPIGQQRRRDLADHRPVVHRSVYVLLH